MAYKIVDNTIQYLKKLEKRYKLDIQITIDQGTDILELIFTNNWKDLIEFYKDFLQKNNVTFLTQN